MKTLNSKLISLFLMAIVLVVSSCAKEDPDLPTPPDPDDCDACNTFEDSDIYEVLGPDDIVYGDVFYMKNGVKFRAKHAGGDGSFVETVVLDDTWGGGFDEEALATNANIVQLDFTEKGYDCIHIEFDHGYGTDNGPAVFNINGEETSPDGIMYFWQPDFSFHAAMEGAINTIEWPTGNYYDNLCISECDMTYPPAPPEVFCLNFDSYSFDEMVLTSETEYGVRRWIMSGVEFYLKYEDHIDFDEILNFGVYDLDLAGYSDENVNFDGSGWGFNEVTCRVDFTSLVFSNKRVSFDVSNEGIDIDDINEFNVNGAGAGTLPAGIVYNIIDLGLAGNGLPCYRVEITGEINSLEWRGAGIAYDNLCIEEL